MSGKTTPKLKKTKEMARLLRRTESAITKAYRVGTFGDTVQRGPRGELLFRWPAARDAFNANTDTTRARPEHLAPRRAAPAVARMEVPGGLDKIPAGATTVMVWSGPGGSYACSLEITAALDYACEHPDEDCLTPDLAEHLDRIMRVTYGDDLALAEKAEPDWVSP